MDPELRELLFLSLQFGVLYSEMLSTSPKWTNEVTSPLRDIVDSMYNTFN